MAVHFNLFDLTKRLERERGEPVTQAYIADRAGLSRYTVQKIMNDDSDRVDLSTLGKLLRFFHSEGMTETSFNDLFWIESIDEKEAVTPNDLLRVETKNDDDDD